VPHPPFLNYPSILLKLQNLFTKVAANANGKMAVNNIMNKERILNYARQLVLEHRKALSESGYLSRS